MTRLILLLVFLAQSAAADPAIDALSRYRAANGLPPVSHAPRLAAMARAHALDLARTGRLSHTGSDGSRIDDRARRAGYRFCTLAENVARGQRSLSEVMNGWAGSRGHRANMLRRDISEAALVRAEGNVWVMVLGRSGC